MVQTLRLENKGLNSSDFHTHQGPNVIWLLSPWGFGHGYELEEDMPAGLRETDSFQLGLFLQKLTRMLTKKIGASCFCSR